MSDVTAKLRILATTDLHMNLSGFDFAADAQGPGFGLAGISVLVSKARAQAQQQGCECVLFDNGDFLQGTALADWLSTQAVTPDHPLAASFNAMRYDAIGLGNHDLDFQTCYLSQLISVTNAPVLSSNLESTCISGLKKATILDRKVQTPQGCQTIRIGVISALPVETTIWNRDDLPSGMTIENPVCNLGRIASRLRQEGADLIVALAHMGLGDDGPLGKNGEYGARLLGGVPEIDVVIAGHTHQRFAKTDSNPQITAPSFPTIMPGNAASDLGLIDLDLAQDAGGKWRITQHHSQLWPQSDTAVPDPAIIAHTEGARQATRAFLAQKVGETTQDLHSYFGLVSPSTTMALAARAKAIAVKHALLGRPEIELPVLATATARAVGGFSGPSNYIHIPKGPVLRRHLTSFAPSTNRVSALIVTGIQLQKWLEQSARIYNRLVPELPEQHLLDRAHPSFIFDTIYGLDYLIDPSQPVGQRITSLLFNNRPVAPDQQFILATNHFRAAGGGGYEGINIPAALFHGAQNNTELLEQALQTNDLADWMTDAPWRLACETPLQATFECSPDAAGYLEAIKAVAPKILGRTKTGFDCIQITL